MDTGWKSLSGTSLNLQSYASGERDVKIYVRLKPTNSASASLPMEIVIPKLALGPAGRIDYFNEAVVDLVNQNYQYSVNGSSWTGLTISDGQWDISKLITANPRTLYLRKADAYFCTGSF